MSCEMYFGHYGIGLVLKRFAKNISLGWLFLAVQFVDILAATLMILGIEKANVVPGFAAASSFEYVFYPFSHSLVAFLVWAGVFYIFFRLVQINPDLENSRVALIMGLGVLSHFALDVIVHTPDLPVLGNDSYMMGVRIMELQPYHKLHC